MAGVGSAAVRALGAVGVAMGLAVSTVPAVAAAPAAARTEELYASCSEVAGVESSVVQVRIPLPPEAEPRPEQCDWLSYLRFRDSNGPADSADADRVVIAQPGIFEGAGAMESLARNSVRAAADNGQFVEFWALDRRSNCLEDNSGIQAALIAEDFSVAAD